jgi:hypothetical protein
MYYLGVLGQKVEFQMIETEDRNFFVQKIKSIVKNVNKIKTHTLQKIEPFFAFNLPIKAENVNVFRRSKLS